MRNNKKNWKIQIVEITLFFASRPYRLCPTKGALKGMH